MNILVFLASSIINYQQSMNTYSMPVTNLNSIFLKSTLEKVLWKLAATNFIAIPVIIDRLGINSKIEGSLT